MTINRVTVGSGMTEEERLNYSGEDLQPHIVSFFKDWNRRLEKGGGVFGAVTLDLVDGCRKILATAPPTERSSRDFPLPGLRERDSIEDFAERMLLHFDLARRQQALGDTESAMRFAYELGRLAGTAEMKFTWEAAAMRGERNMRAAMAGHAAVHGTREQKRERWQRLVDDLDTELRRGTKRTAAYGLVAERHGVSSKQVQRAYYGYLKKP